MEAYFKYFRFNLKFLVIAVLLLGIFFRGTHIDRKVYWHDEVFTPMQASGYSTADVDAKVFTGVPLSPQQLLQYQRLSPDRGWDKTWQALSLDPVHLPFYFLLERLWMTWFGSTVTVTRSLSVVFSLLSFPALYWFCRELFDRPTFKWIALALFAVSPFQVLYAQEARPYSLWILAMLLSSAAFLRALRRQTWGSWALYAAAVALLLNTFILSSGVLICHGLTVWLDSPRSRRSLQCYGISLAAGLLTVIPWIIVQVQNWESFSSKTAWTTISPPKSFLLKLWGLHFSSSFIDLGLPLEHLYAYIIPPIIGILMGCAIWLLCQHAARRAWLLILLLMTLPVMILILPDIVLGGQRSVNGRYFAPALVSTQLVAAYGLAHLIEYGRFSLRQVGKVLFVVILVAGILSCTLSWQADTWWSKGSSYNNAALARSINQLHQPIIVRKLGNTTLGDTISLSYLVKDDVRFIMVK
jgi:uncharacterized membrane protein